MDNAIKYRSPDRQLIIRIFSEQTAEGVRYCFADNGIGIPHEHLDRIWEIFHRVNRNETQGEGLGLTMSRRIIDRLGGSMYMESEPGSGSRFYVTLPAVPVTELPEAEVHTA
jgi:signal transduction histidine kinase